MSEIQQRLGDLVERIIYRRDQSVGQEKRDLLAADANLIAETQARLTRAEEVLRTIADNRSGTALYLQETASEYFASMRGATPEACPTCGGAKDDRRSIGTTISSSETFIKWCDDPFHPMRDATSGEEDG